MSDKSSDDAYKSEQNPSFPPSYKPSSKRHTSKSSYDNGYDNTVLPQFSPQNVKQRSSKRHNANSIKASAYQNSNELNANIPPSFAPNSAKRKTSSSSNVISTSNYENASSNNAYVSTQNSIANNANSANISRNNSDSYIYENSTNNNSNHKKRKKHYVLITISLLLSILLIVAAILGFNAYHFVESNMKKTAWTTNTPDTQEKTWLILGSDQREGAEAKEITGFRMDTILVLTKPVNGHSSLISIPRDSLVSINNRRMKINSVAQIFGKPALTKVVESITGHHIDHVAEIRFEGLTRVVDSMDGVELCYNRTVKDRFSGLDWKAGCHHSNGATALAFARMRHGDPESDFGRAKRQRMVISAIIKKASSKDTLTNFDKVKKLSQAGLNSIIFDENSTPMSLIDMALAFKDATGADGISGTVYWTNPNYIIRGIGSSVLLDDSKNIELFNQLSAGTHTPGSVGTLAEMTH